MALQSESMDTLREGDLSWIEQASAAPYCLDAPAQSVYDCPHHRPQSLGLRWLRDACAPAPAEAHMRDWLVPPVLFPIFLVLLIAGYAILRTPT